MKKSILYICCVLAGMLLVSGALTTVYNYDTNKMDFVQDLTNVDSVTAEEVTVDVIYFNGSAGTRNITTNSTHIIING